MSTSRLVRGTKSRFFLYVCAFTAFVLVIYVFHGSQKQIEESQKSAAMCLQQQESLSAQLQVIFEYKLRLEKSLQKEKADHKTLKEECQSKAQEEKVERDRENLEAQNKYNALQQHYSLLQSKHEDLTEECNKIRKERLEGIEEKSQLEKMLSAVKLEMQQMSAAKEKTLEAMKSKYAQLEVDKERLQKENEQLKQEKLPESSRVALLEKTNAQLENELSEVKKQLISFNGDQSNILKKSSVSAVNVEQSFGVEPPKLNPTGNNLSTTPGINPEAVIEHDASLKPVPSKSLQFNQSKVLANLKSSTQSAALPIQVPANQEDLQAKDVANEINFEENGHLIPPDLVREPVPIPRAPETNVINKPDLRQDEQKRDELNEENQGGEVVQEVPGPMNPIQDNEVIPNVAPFHKFLENKRLANQWETKDNHAFVGRRPDLNGAHEEGDEEVAPIPQQNWRLDEGKVIPRNMMKHEYQGGDYDKEPPEEEEDEEGEQLDYIGAEPGLKHVKQMAKLRQLEGNGAGIMVIPK